MTGLDGLVDAYLMGQVQAGMVYEMLVNGSHPAYQNVTSFDIVDDGPFSLAALQQAAQWLVDRHEILRTTFDVSGYTEPMQLVHAEARVEVGFDDLRELPEAEQQDILERYRETMKLAMLPIDHAPQLRWHVHRTGERTWVLTHTECHAILDGWSHHSLIAELRDTYRAIRDADPDALKPPPRGGTPTSSGWNGDRCRPGRTNGSGGAGSASTTGSRCRRTPPRPATARCRSCGCPGGISNRGCVSWPRGRRPRSRPCCTPRTSR